MSDELPQLPPLPKIAIEALLTKGNFMGMGPMRKYINSDLEDLFVRVKQDCVCHEYVPGTLCSRCEVIQHFVELVKDYTDEKPATDS